MNNTRRCRECGCTELQACPGGCHWIEIDLCSACQDKPPRKITTIDGLKRRAKRIKKAEGIQHSKALDKAAQEAGFSNFVHARRQLAARAAP